MRLEYSSLFLKTKFISSIPCLFESKVQRFKGTQLHILGFARALGFWVCGPTMFICL